STTTKLKTDFTYIDNLYKAYTSACNTNAPISELEEHRQLIVTKLTEFQQNYNAYVNQDNSPILVKRTNHEELDALLTITTNYFALKNQNVDFTNIETHKSICTRVANSQNLTTINNYINELIDVKISNETITDLNSYIATATTYMNTIEAEFNEIIKNNDVEKIEIAKDLAKEYYLVSLNIYELVNNQFTYEPVSEMLDSTIHQYLNYNNFYSYQIQEQITKQIYLVENNAVITDFADVFSPGQTSNSTANAFDFVYFGLEIFGFIILIFSVVLGAGMVAGEHSNGTLKLLTIRPYSRSKILTSKIISTLIFGTILTIFSALVLFIIGITMYGSNFTPILGVFNATTAYVISPISLLLIYILFLLFKILIYTLFAVAISVIFRSNAAAIGVSMAVYFMSTLFSVLFSSSYWFAFWPFVNLDLFKYMGGAFITQTAFNPLAIAFSSPMLYNSTFLISIIISLVIGILFAFIAYFVFNKREIK
ncbi:MAG: ABC transporter permease subunit, partial [Clostridia bacterium]|nr:ABC transporter permease subunit [Clostridia bacterium]